MVAPAIPFGAAAVTRRAPDGRKPGADRASGHRGRFGRRLADSPAVRAIVVGGISARSCALVAVVGAVASLLESAALVVVFGLLADATDHGRIEPDGLVIAGGLLAARAATGLGSAVLVARQTRQASRTVRERLWSAHLARPTEWLSESGRGQLTTLSGQGGDYVSHAVYFSCALVLASASAVALFVLAASQQAAVTIGLVVAIAAVTTTARPLARMTRRASQERLGASVDYADGAMEGLEQAIELRVFGVEAEHRRHLDALGARLADAMFRVRFGGLATPEVLQTLILAVFVGAITVIVTSLEGDQVAVAAAAAALTLRGGQQVQRAMSSIQSILELGSYVDGVADYLARTDVLAAATPRATAGTTEEPDLVRLRSVGLGRPDGSRALEDIDLAIRRGDRIGLVGPSGAGKSTLGLVVAGVLRPTDGSRCALEGLQVALVPQHVHLLETSPLENVRYLRDDIADARLVEAARVAGLGWLVDDERRWRHGRLGRDTQLSGGEAQRLGIARALAGDPDLIVMDEPTSALDDGTEAEVLDAVARIDERTALVVISHRPAPLELCRTVVELREGRRVTPEPFIDLRGGPQGDGTAPDGDTPPRDVASTRVAAGRAVGTEP